MATNHRYYQIQQVTFIGVAENILLGCLKLIFGLIGHSQALVADGIHSFSDLITDILVLAGSKLGSQAPDKEHPYGHGRIETASTVILAIILIVVGVGIIFDGFYAVLHQTYLKPSISVFVIAVISILINEWLFHYTMRVANRTDSDLLRANAWHKRSDALSSVIVLIGISGEMMGYHFLDPIAAIVVALMVMKMGVSMVWRSTRELVDTGVDDEILQHILQELKKVSGVCSFHQLRTRSVGGKVFLDVHIQVDPKLSVSEGHFIADQVQAHLLEKLPRLEDVIVHVDLEDDELQAVKYLDLLLARPSLEAKLAAYWKDLPGYSQIEKINFHYIGSKIEIEVILPIIIINKIEDAKKVNEQYQNAVKDVKVIVSVTVYFV